MLSDLGVITGEHFPGAKQIVFSFVSFDALHCAPVVRFGRALRVICWISILHEHLQTIAGFPL